MRERQNGAGERQNSCSCGEYNRSQFSIRPGSNNPAAQAQVVLPVIETVGNLRQKVLRSWLPNSQMFGPFEVHATSSCQRELILRTRLPDTRGGQDASKENLSERRKPVPPQTRPGNEETGKSPRQLQERNSRQDLPPRRTSDARCTRFGRRRSRCRFPEDGKPLALELTLKQT
jgi:hypothetical protein